MFRRVRLDMNSLWLGVTVESLEDVGEDFWSKNLLAVDGRYKVQVSKLAHGKRDAQVQVNEA